MVAIQKREHAAHPRRRSPILRPLGTAVQRARPVPSCRGEPGGDNVCRVALEEIMRRLVSLMFAPSLAAGSALYAQGSGAMSVGSAAATPGTIAYGAIAVPAGSDSALQIAVAVV